MISAVSAAVLEEVRDVLQRPGIRRAFPKMTDENVLDFLEHIVDRGHTVENVPGAYRLERDPDDEPFLNLAIATGSSFIVSRDRDFWT